MQLPVQRDADPPLTGTALTRQFQNVAGPADHCAVLYGRRTGGWIVDPYYHDDPFYYDDPY